MDAIKMDLYGFYMQNDAQNQLDGSIDILPNGAFTGEIFDYGSVTPEQKIMGHIIKDKNLVRLIFIKSPSSQNLANLLYQLECPITKLQPFSFKRAFKGKWEALPYKIVYDSNYKIFTAQIDRSVAGIGDEAEINIGL